MFSTAYCFTQFSALDGVTFSWRISRAVRFPSCAYTDASPGVGSLVGGEISKSPEARLLVSVRTALGGGYWCSLLHIVLLMFSALDGVTFSWRISRAVRFPSCAYTDASPGVGSLVGGEIT